MKKNNQIPPDTTKFSSGFSHIILLFGLSLVALTTFFVGKHLFSTNASVEGAFIAQTNPQYLNLEGNFYDLDGTSPMLSIGPEGNIILPMVEIKFDTGESIRYRSNSRGRFNTSGLRVPANAKSFTLKSLVGGTVIKFADKSNCTPATTASLPNFYSCAVESFSTNVRTNVVKEMDFNNTLNLRSPTATITRVDKKGNLNPGDTFKVKVTATGYQGVRLNEVNLEMLYTYETSEYSCSDVITPVIQGDKLNLTNMGGTVTVDVTVPAFPVDPNHTYARPKFLAVYPVVSTKPVSLRGIRYCTGKPVNKGQMCPSECVGTSASAVEACTRKMSLWQGCGTSYSAGTQPVSSVVGAHIYVPISATDASALVPYEITARRIGTNDPAPKLVITNLADVPLTGEIEISNANDATGLVGNLPAGTTIDDIKIKFANADDNYEVNERGLRIIDIKLNGVKYVVWDSKTYSEGADAILCGFGFGQGNVLYCKNSYFRFSSKPPHTLELRMNGTASGSIFPDVEVTNVAINNYPSRSFGRVSVTEDINRQYKFTIPSWLKLDDLRINYVNDTVLPDGVNDRNLRLDYVKFNSVIYQTENATVYSVGSWSSDNFCGGGYKMSEWLHCNGYFQFKQ